MGEKKNETSGNPQGEREFTYPSCGIVYVVAWPVSQRSAYETSYWSQIFPGQFSTLRFIGGEVAQPVLGRSWNHRLWYFTPIPRIDRLKHQPANHQLPKNLKKYGIWRIYSHNNLLICYVLAIFNNPQLWPVPKKRRWSLTTGVFFRSLPGSPKIAWMKRHVGCPTWQRPGLVSTIFLVSTWLKR